MTTDEQRPVPYDRCKYCDHTWHGVTCICKVVVTISLPHKKGTRDCGCVSSIPEFRVEREKVNHT